MRINWDYIKFVLLLLLTGFLYAFASHRNGQRLVPEVTIQFDDESKPFVTRESVNKLLIQKGGNLTKSTKEKLVLKEMEAQVTEHPLVRKADVFIAMNGVLGVAVEQRKPIARVNSVEPFYIGSEGEVMPLSSNFSARVLLVNGVSKEDVKEIHGLVSFIREDAFLEKHIVGIVKKSNGDYVLTPRAYNYKVVLGKVEKLPLKFNNYKAFYKKAHNDKTLKNYGLITLKYDNQVVCTKRSNR